MRFCNPVKTRRIEGRAELGPIFIVFHVSSLTAFEIAAGHAWRIDVAFSGEVVKGSFPWNGLTRRSSWARGRHGETGVPLSESE